MKLSAILGFFAALFVAATPHAQMGQIPQYLPMGGYVGPGDLFDITSFYSCRYSVTRAYALPGTNVACKLEIIVPGSTGFFGVSTQTTGQECDLLIGPNGIADFYNALSCDGGTKTVDDWGAARNYPAAVGVGDIIGTAMTIDSCSSCNFKPLMWIGPPSDIGGGYIISQDSGTPGGVGGYTLGVTGSPNKINVSITASSPYVVAKVVYDQRSGAFGNQERRTSDPANTLQNSIQVGWGVDRASCRYDGCWKLDTVNSYGTAGYLSLSSAATSSPLGLFNVSERLSSHNQGYIGVHPYSSTQQTNTIFNNNASNTCGGSTTLCIGLGNLQSSSFRTIANGTGDNTDVLRVNDTEATKTPGQFNSNAGNAQIFGFSGQAPGTFEWYESGVSNGVDYTATIRSAFCNNAKKRYPALSAC